MYKKVIFLFSFLFYSYFIFGQHTIQGTVVDESQQPIESANIYFDGSTIGTVTNSQGKFSLQIDKATQAPLIISSLGYNSIIKEISLNKEIIVLETIVLKKGEVDSRQRKIFLNEKGKKLFEEIFIEQKKRIYNALKNSDSDSVIKFKSVLNKIINE